MLTHSAFLFEHRCPSFTKLCNSELTQWQALLRDDVETRPLVIHTRFRYLAIYLTLKHDVTEEVTRKYPESSPKDFIFVASLRDLWQYILAGLL